MKKLVYVLIFALILVSASAAAESAYVTITTGDGSIALAREAVELSDTDGDGVLSIADALYIAHENAYEGGAAAGFLAEDMGYGLSMSKLWGEENGGSYGYYLNNASPMSLLDPVAGGDHVKAYAFMDLTTWSDTFCYFQTDSADMGVGELSLTLTALVFDANWNPVETPVENAVITINGADTEFVTNADGIAAITISEAGEYIISARSDSMTLVPPVCVASVS